MDYIIYEDNLCTDFWINLVMALPAGILILTAVYVALTEPDEFIYIATATSVIIPILYIIIPTQYVIYNNQIRINFRGPICFKIPFATIRLVRPQKWNTIGINLPARISTTCGIEIVRKRRMIVNITPSDKETFLNQFNSAYTLWKTSNGGYIEAD